MGKNKSFKKHGQHRPAGRQPHAAASTTGGQDNNTIQPVKASHPEEPKKLSKQEKRNLRKQQQRTQGANLGLTSSSSAAPSTSTAGNNHHQDSTTGTGVTSSVYKRIPTYPNSFPMSNSESSKGFIEAHHKNFAKILSTCYEGLAVESGDKFTPTFHEKFQHALQELETLGFYQFDYTQPAGLGTKVAKTFVTRCVVGDPGMTYKYLGLRMFGFPWASGVLGSNAATVAIGDMNQELIKRSNDLNAASGKAEYGSSQFNLTLINRCYPDGEVVALKLDPMFEKDHLTVSWHADSCLDHYSTIAVYHFNEEDPKKKQKPWRISLRVQLNAEGPQQGKPAPVEVEAPPIAVTLPKECVYYLLDDFNHHHQHSVLAGGSNRYASTHRVSRREGHTFQYIQQRCHSVLHEKSSADKKTIRKLLLVSIEVEFEWIRQFYIQGQKHFGLHVWWHQPMQDLISFLQQIEQRIVKVFKALISVDSAQSNEGNNRLSKDEMKMKILKDSIEDDSYDEMIQLLEDRLEKRKGWESREKDPMYESAPDNAKPLPVPIGATHELWNKVLNFEETSANANILYVERSINMLRNAKNKYLQRNK